MVERWGVYLATNSADRRNILNIFEVVLGKTIDAIGRVRLSKKYGEEVVLSLHTGGLGEYQFNGDRRPGLTESHPGLVGGQT